MKATLERVLTCEKNLETYIVSCRGLKIFSHRPYKNGEHVVLIEGVVKERVFPISILFDSMKGGENLSLSIGDDVTKYVPAHVLEQV